MGNNSVPKFIFRLSRFPVYRGSVLGRFYCIIIPVKLFKKKKTAERSKLTNSVERTDELSWVPADDVRIAPTDPNCQAQLTKRSPAAAAAAAT